jgi:hypothetical protein
VRFERAPQENEGLVSSEEEARAISNRIGCILGPTHSTVLTGYNKSREKDWEQAPNPACPYLPASDLLRGTNRLWRDENWLPISAGWLQF